MNEQQQSPRYADPAWAGEEDSIFSRVVLSDMWKGFLRFGWMWMLGLGIVCAIVSAVHTALTFSPRYEAVSTFTVKASTGMSDSDDRADYSYYYSSQSAEQMASTFPYIIHNDVMYDVIKQDLGVSSISASITADVVPDTNMITVKVQDVSAESALAVLNSVMENYPQVARYVLGSTKLSVLKKPTASDVPVNQPSYPRKAAKGALAGVAIGLVVLFLYAVTRSTIRREEDFRDILNQKCLGMLPLMKFKKIRGDASDVVSVLNPRVNSAFRESVRALRIHVLKDLEEHPDERVVLVTSTVPNEGKTTVALNLALSLAQNGASVILVDADLRNQTVKKALGLEDESDGLMEVLEQTVSAEQALVQYEDTRVRLLAGDHTAEHPSEQLGSQQMALLIEQLRTMADYIVLDSAPCGMLSDAISLAEYADCALYVVKQDYAKNSRILNGLERLSISRIRIMGGVFNGIASGLSGYGYGYYGHYGRYGRYGRYGSYGKQGYGEKEHEERQLAARQDTHA